MRTTLPSTLTTTMVAVTASLLCGSVWAQTAAPPAPARESSSQSSDADMSTAAQHRPKVGREAKATGITAGSIVQSPQGQAIGRVKDIVPDANSGEPAYVVISTRSGTAAVPYSVVAPQFQSGHVVLDRARLESAPRVSAAQLQDKSDATWRSQADRYWDTRNPANL